MPSRRDVLKGAAALSAAGIAGRAGSALAQGRAETLVVVQELAPNSLDMMGPGANQTVNGIAWNCYDRLVTYGTKTLADGTVSYDKDVLKPELALEWQEGSQGMDCTFKLRKDATFHDGKPVTAKDVKWSMDRAVSIGGFPTFQMKAGSLEKPEQFVVVDDHTFRIDYLRKDKLTLPDMGVSIPFVINSEVAKQHATAQEPWAIDFLKNNSAGGGAFKVESWKPGTETVLTRFDNWKSGPLPKMRRVLLRDVPSPSSRRALLERGDADITFGLPPKDFDQLSKEGKLKVVGTPIPNGIWHVGMLTTKPPFDNVKVRQAVAYAIPYQAIMESAFFGRGAPVWGGPAKAQQPIWPIATPYTTDLTKAKALLVEAGITTIDTTLSIDTGTAQVGEPAAVLIAESLAKIGINVRIDKIPGANWRTELNKKSLPMMLNLFSGWLDVPEYFFFWNYHGQNSIFNIASYQNPEMDKLIDAARFPTDQANYAGDVKGFLDLFFRDMPVVPINQPTHDVAMQKSITGYEFWFHRQLDYRKLAKG